MSYASERTEFPQLRRNFGLLYNSIDSFIIVLTGTMVTIGNWHRRENSLKKNDVNSHYTSPLTKTTHVRAILVPTSIVFTYNFCFRHKTFFFLHPINLSIYVRIYINPSLVIVAPNKYRARHTV